MMEAGMYRELVENSDNIVVVTDSQFKIQYVSAAIERSFDIPPVSLLGKSIFDFVNAERALVWRECLSQPQPSFSEEISLDITGERKAYFDVHVSDISSMDGRPVAFQLHDITEKKNRESELIKSNQQLDQVIYKTTHDLRSPVRSALGLIHLAKNASSSEKDFYLDMIAKSLSKLDVLIEDMNDFFRNEKLALQREEIFLRDEIAEEIDLLNTPHSGTPIRFDIEFEQETEFFSDAVRVRTILTNILSNAIKYYDPKKSEPFIRIIVLIDKEFCHLRVVDNGIGISSEHLNKIFDLFFRGTDQSQGTGIGLFIVKDTIQKLNGTIEVTSTLGQGTTFTIQIPNQIYQPVLVE